jgi:Endonuclease/Exonuclease/phosphatase family.
LVKKELKHCIKEINGTSKRITVLALMINETSIYMIQVYAPTEASTEEDIEFYNLLDDTLNNYKTQRTFVMGDFNIKIGHRDYGEEEVMGPHGFGARNERGDKLIQFAQGQRLKNNEHLFQENPIQ